MRPRSSVCWARPRPASPRSWTGATFHSTTRRPTRLLRAHADAGLRTVSLAGQEPATRELLARLDRIGAGPSTTIASGPGRPTSSCLASDWGRRPRARSADPRARRHRCARSRVGGRARRARAPRRGRHARPPHGARRRRLRRDRGVGRIGRAHAGERHGRAGTARRPSSSSSTATSGPGWASATSGWRPGDVFAQMRATISVQHATVFDLKLAGKGGAPAAC